jgi:hypothetical protein
MSSHIVLRIIFTVVFSLAVMWTPWWVAGVIALAGMMYFDWYAEALVGAFIFDALYGTGGMSNVIFTSITGILLMVLLVLKQWIRIDSSF